MKYIIFGIAVLVGIPSMTALGLTSRRMRTLLYALLLISVAAADQVSINFISHENYRGGDRGFEVTLTEVIAISLVIVLLLLPPVSFPKPRRVIPPATLLMLLYFLFAVVSAFAASQPLYSWFSVWKLPRMYLIYLTLYLALTREKNLSTVFDGLWWGITIIGLYVGLLALQQRYLFGMYRIRGPFDHSNTVPAFLHQLSPVLLAWTLGDRNLPRWRTGLAIVSVLFMLVAVVTTQSRAGMVVALGGLVGALILTARRRPSRDVGIAALLLVVVVGIGLAVAMDTIVDRFVNAPESSEQAREEFNVAARQMAGDHAFGIGINNFSWVLTNEADYREHIVVTQTEEEAGVAHHIYLLTAAELGYPGLIAMLLVLGVLLLFALRLFFADRKGIAGLIAGAIAIGAIALHVTGFIEWVFRITPTAYIYIIMSSIAVGLSERYRLSEGNM